MEASNPWDDSLLGGLPPPVHATNEPRQPFISDDKTHLEATIVPVDGCSPEQEWIDPLLDDSYPPVLDTHERRPAPALDDNTKGVNNIAASSADDWLDTAAEIRKPGDQTDSDTDETDDEVEEKQLCQECKREPGVWYCGSCTQRYCEKCWKKKSPHKPKNPEHTKHMKVPYANHLHFQDILNPRWNPETRRDMHDQDNWALWFSISIAKSSSIEFEDFPRFLRLLEEHTEEHGGDTHLPRLVSFVGNTGAGKSTLIRMVLEKPWRTSAIRGTQTTSNGPHAPIVGMPHATVPTSGDVHLYRDQSEELDNIARPLFYADCEGFHGGEVAPPGSFAVQKELNQTGLARTVFNNWFQYVVGRVRKRTVNFTSDHDQGRPRDAAVRKIFPRLLYNFSDVVIFVVSASAARSLHEGFEKIIDWASASRGTATNRVSPPRLIVVINHADEGAEWDPDKTTDEIFEEHKGLLEGNTKIREHKESFEERNIPIVDLKDLLCKSYRSVKFIRVPRGHIRSQLSIQLQLLSKLIDEGSKESQMEKDEAGMLLPSRDQDNFYQLAFDHFVKHPDKPFNFLAGLLKLHPMANSLSNNVSRILQATDKLVPPDVDRPSWLFRFTMPVIASAIALDVYRFSPDLPSKLREIFEGGLGPSGQPQTDLEFETYEAQIKRAIDNFCDNIECGALVNGQLCRKARRAHTNDHHEDAKGEYIGCGPFDDTFANKIIATWKDALLSEIDKVDEKVNNERRYFISNGCQAWTPLHSKAYAAWSVHFGNLKDLYVNAPGLDGKTSPHIFVCLFCLREMPSRLLPCGHAICVRCVTAIAIASRQPSSKDQRTFDLDSCPLHTEATYFDPKPALYFKPRFAGYRILALDGGGVRGLIEIGILKAIDAELMGKIPIQHFFDLVGGTSTGALVAMGLVLNNWTLLECRSKYTLLCKDAFTKHGSAWSGNAYAYYMHGFLYQDAPLERILRNEFGDGRMLTHVTTEAKGYDPKVFATATKDEGKKACVFTNYIRSHEDEDESVPSNKLHDYEMRKDESLEFKRWEVAKATCAAPMYFSSFSKDGSSRYWDGGLKNNNPSLLALQEAQKLWPEVRTEHPDLLLSIGSGSPAEERRPKPASELPKPTRWQRFKNKFTPGGLTGLEVLKTTLLYNMDSEQLWQSHFGQREDLRPTRQHYTRLNPLYHLPKVPPELDDVKALDGDELDKMAESYVEKHPTDIRRVAHRLIASSLYFEPQSMKDCVSDADFKGHMACRFLNGTEDLRGFFDILKEKLGCFEFKLKETDEVLGYKLAGSDSTLYEVGPQELEIMRDKCCFKLDSVIFSIPKQLQSFTITIGSKEKHADGSSKFAASPISGCPFKLREAAGDPIDRALVSMIG